MTKSNSLIIIPDYHGQNMSEEI